MTQAVIGAAANDIPQPAQRAKPFVIGAAAENVASPAVVRNSPAVIGAGRENYAPLELHPNLRNQPSNERSGVVIGLRNDRRKK